VAVLAHTTGLPLPGLREPRSFDGQLAAVLGLETAALLALALVLAGGIVAARWLVPVTFVAVVAAAVPAAGVRHDHTADAGGHAEAHAEPSASHAPGEPGHASDDAELRYKAFTAGLADNQVEAVLDDYERYFADHLMRTGVARDQALRAMDAAMKGYVRSGEGNGGHGHTGPAPWQPLADEATRDTLARQLVAARQATAALPTAADAVKAGYFMIVPYLPGIGAHYVKLSYLADDVFDPAKPEILLYSGNYPDSEVVGASYLAGGAKDTPPEGFAGPNDGFHFHDQLCWVQRLVVPARDAATCADAGGRFRGITGTAIWMNHVWVVPGWESPWGLFSPEHPDLTLAVGRPR